MLRDQAVASGGIAGLIYLAAASAAFTHDRISDFGASITHFQCLSPSGQGTYYIAEAQQKRQRVQKPGPIDFEPISQHNLPDRRQGVGEGVRQ